MSDNAEEGIARAQAAAAKANNATGLADTHKRSIINLNERILVHVGLILFIALILLWVVTKSAFLFYLSMASFMLLAVLVGYIKIRNIHQTRSQRSQQAANWKSQK